jgi:chromosome segregation ATPase
MQSEEVSDLVKRLRDPWFTNGCEKYQHEAAARIEQLERELAEARQREEDAVSQHDTLRDQRDAEKALADRLRKQADYDRRQSDHKSTVIDRLNSEIDAYRRARGL